MLIGIDALGIEKASGGRTSVLNLLRSLFQIDQENQYLVAVSTYEPSFNTPDGNVKQLLLPVRNRFLRRIFGQFVLPLRMSACNLIHFTKNLSLFGLIPPYILTIHDLSMLKYPHLMPWTDLLYWRSVQKESARKAERIITVSQNAANDIHHFYGITYDKIRVIYHGVASNFSPAELEDIRRVRDKYSLPAEYILHVGRIDPIKNLPALVRAFHLLKLRHQYSGKLVIVGEFYKKTPDQMLLPTIEQLGIKDDVILTGYVSDEDLPAVYSAARLKVFPSHNEGFGLAPLEAMACGTPVVVHKAGGALVEVVGNAGIIIENNDPETLHHAIFKILGDVRLEQELRKAAKERAAMFSWDKAARQTLELYKEVVG